VTHVSKRPGSITANFFPESILILGMLDAWRTNAQNRDACTSPTVQAHCQQDLSHKIGVWGILLRFKKMYTYLSYCRVGCSSHAEPPSHVRTRSETAANGPLHARAHWSAPLYIDRVQRKNNRKSTPRRPARITAAAKSAREPPRKTALRGPVAYGVFESPAASTAALRKRAAPEGAHGPVV
jgi:hypothetical protein